MLHGNSFLLLYYSCVRCSSALDPTAVSEIPLSLSLVILSLFFSTTPLLSSSTFFSVVVVEEVLSVSVARIKFTLHLPAFPNGPTIIPYSFVCGIYIVLPTMVPRISISGVNNPDTIAVGYFVFFVIVVLVGVGVVLVGVGVVLVVHGFGIGIGVGIFFLLVFVPPPTPTVSGLIISSISISIVSPFTLSTIPVASINCFFLTFLLFFLLLLLVVDCLFLDDLDDVGGSIRDPDRAEGILISSCRIFFSGSYKNLRKGKRRISPSLAVVPAGKTTRNLPEVPKADFNSPISPPCPYRPLPVLPTAGNPPVITFMPKNGFNNVSFLNKSLPYNS
mmetsp:Transcript_28268/g.30447  ORF Transcript_28268/g.30447 Transcript_28268/m.30447 type:complete len:333 (-) Transcript_28268:1223-2221(-)